MNLAQSESTRPHAARRTVSAVSNTWNFTEFDALLSQRPVLGDDPDRKLRLAVLEEAFNQAKSFAEYGFQGRVGSKRYLDERNDYDHLKRWVEGARARISFRECCELFDLNVSWMRRGFLRVLYQLGQGYQPPNADGRVHRVRRRPAARGLS